MIIRKMFTALGMFIPRKTKREASFAVDVLDDEKPESIREDIAARRASDPTFNKAFEMEKKRRREK